MCFAKDCEVHTEAAISGFSSRNGLKDQIHGRARGKCRHLCCDVGQHATLRWNLESLPQVIDQPQQTRRHRNIVTRGVNADHRISGTEQQTIENRSGNAHCVVGRMIGLEARTQPARQSHGRPKARDHAYLCGSKNQILYPHELAHACGHLRGEAGGERSQPLRRGFVGEQPVAQLAHSKASDGRESLRIVRIHNQSRYLVLLVGDYVLREEMLQRQVSQCKLRSDPLFGGVRRYARKHISAPQGSRLREQFPQIGKCVATIGYGDSEAHTVALMLPELDQV